MRRLLQVFNVSIETEEDYNVLDHEELRNRIQEMLETLLLTRERHRRVHVVSARRPQIRESHD